MAEHGRRRATYDDLLAVPDHLVAELIDGELEPELHLGDDVLVPDIGGWRRERMPELPTTPWFGVSPDWVCEVLSPSTSLLDRVAGADEEVGLPPFEAVPLKLGELWPG